MKRKIFANIRRFFLPIGLLLFLECGGRILREDLPEKTTVLLFALGIIIMIAGAGVLKGYFKEYLFKHELILGSSVVTGFIACVIYFYMDNNHLFDLIIPILLVFGLLCINTVLWFGAAVLDDMAGIRDIAISAEVGFKRLFKNK